MGEEAALLEAGLRLLRDGRAPGRQLRRARRLFEHARVRAGRASGAPPSLVLGRAQDTLGCPHATGLLGRCFMAGWGGPVDFARAVQLARDAAAAGSAWGHFVLGRCYQCGPHPPISRWNAAAVCQWPSGGYAQTRPRRPGRRGALGQPLPHRKRARQSGGHEQPGLYVCAPLPSLPRPLSARRARLF
jgi:TPR repeat protein